MQVLDKPIPYMGGVSLILLIKACLILLIIAVFSKILIMFLKKKVFTRYNIKVGTQESISRLIHYFLIILGVFITLDYLGINMTTLAALSAVLMVGIGFGLQNITSNFISGLILLFERPIQVGDLIEVSNIFGTVSAINARSTTVTTIDNSTIIVPNSQFISESLTNWSYQDPRIRLHIQVGVSYGADIELVRETLLALGKAHSDVLKEPKPIVYFNEFGDSSLNFDLIVWIEKPLYKFQIRSDLNFATIHAFREKGIEIPFPQRDLHVRSSVPIKTSEIRNSS
ncbi:mechanosensitive ion channel family protein [Candidatus Latescibacterota bacterium]